MPTNPLPSNKETRKQNKSYYNKLRKKFRVYSSKRLQQTNSKIRNKKTRNVQTKVNKMPAITSEATPDKRPAPTRCLRPLRATVLAAATAAASMLTSAATAAAAAAAAATASYTTTTGFVNYNNHNSISTREPDTLERRLQPDVDTDTGGGSRVGVNVDLTNAAAALPNRLANKLLTNFLPAINAVTNATTTTTASSSPTISSSSSSSVGGAAVTYPTFRPPSIENLVASSAEDLSNFRDVSFDIFDDDDDLFGSPLAFDASDNGLWNGRFVPPPPRPPFLVDEPVLSDGLTTCDLCSWAMPTKSTFMFEGTIEKASELGWPLTLIIVSVLSALLGAIVMVTVVRCRRKKPTNNRNETHVQWWSRNKRTNGSNNNNHLRRSNIYTAHPADSVRGLQQPSLSAASSLTTMTAMGASAGPLHSNAVTPNATQPPQQLQQQQQYYHHPYQQHQASLHRSISGHQRAPDYEYEHEYHQPQELQLQLQHQRQHSSSLSSLSDTPTLPVAVANNNKSRTLQLQHQPLQHHHHQQQQQQSQQQQQAAYNVSDGVTVGFGAGVVGVGMSRRGAGEMCEESSSCRWPNATIVVAS
ncbi:probable serine/threonine-protein kinase DDB_G0267686 isoform X2 [Zeugodacus cucurbitae]|uniref:probable serine/threonine-protein kinase DDB_G0267686 isoform X2 n=1 Tax=Zeugodacus cucurbitae TaxID=28588 RepID=UPI0023D922D5|nr:probable serine/threonine-protein kinase DDB_G0267686 isoform X2 [Zeugodacus cucurbitae]